MICFKLKYVCIEWTMERDKMKLSKCKLIPETPHWSTKKFTSAPWFNLTIGGLTIAYNEHVSQQLSKAASAFDTKLNSFIHNTLYMYCLGRLSQI